jgi:hypothetical protein
MTTLFFPAGSVDDYDDALGCDTARFGRFFWEMLARGVYLPCSQFEAAFLSAAHTEADIDRAIQAAAESLAAIQDYVRDGGKLVVTQGDNWQKFKESGLADLLPVTLEGVMNEKGAASLRMLAGMPNFLDPEQLKIENLRPPWRTQTTSGYSVFNPWPDLDKDVPVVKATAKKGAFVNFYCECDKSAPYLARWNYGLGSVVWVANDFGDRQIISRSASRAFGWQGIWDRTMDWRNETLLSLMPKPPDVYVSPTQNKVDLSRSILAGMELPRRGAALVALAMVLFIGYWLVAGPGSYFFLLARRRALFSWVAFAV